MSDTPIAVIEDGGPTDAHVLRQIRDSGRAIGMVELRFGKAAADRFLTALDGALAAMGQGTFQAGVAAWMADCFLPSLYTNMTERGDRVLEEVLEMLQAHGYDPARVLTLVQYVYGRPVGDPAQEVGGVMVTLAGFCHVAGHDMHHEANRELERIRQPEVMAKIRRKQEAKNALHFDTPLPGAEAPHAAGWTTCDRNCDCVGECKAGLEHPLPSRQEG